MGFRVVKVCMIGNMLVGKTCLSIRYVDNSFSDKTLSTLGAAFLKKDVETKNGTCFRLQIWDTSGQERYKAVVPMFYRGASVIVLVYDVTDRTSFTEGVADWLAQLRTSWNPEDLVLALVGNKIDLEDNRQVEEKEGKEYAGKIGAIFMETSAKTGFNVEELFMNICCKLEEKNNNNLNQSLNIDETQRTRHRGLTVVSNDNKLIEPRKKSFECCNR